MRYSEPIAALRRIPVYLVDDDGVPVTGAAPTGSELQVSRSGAAWANGAGAWGEVGSGLYYYQATQAETATASFLLLRVAVTGAQVYVFAVDIGDRIAGDAAAAARCVPIYLVDDDGDGAPGLSPTAEISLAGGAWTAASGAVNPIGLGAYFYQLAESELVPGPGVLRIDDPGAQLLVYAWDVRPAAVEPVAPEPIPAAPSEGGVIPEIDHVAAALARLPHQYRGADG